MGSTWHRRFTELTPELWTGLHWTSESPYPLQDLIVPWIDPNLEGHTLLEQIAAWWKRTDFKLMPHLTQFGSLANLFSELPSLDAVTVCSNMQVFNERELRDTRQFYVQVHSEIM